MYVCICACVGVYVCVLPGSGVKIPAFIAVHVEVFSYVGHRSSVFNQLYRDYSQS